MARSYPVARFLREAGYTKIPGQRRYIAPSGEVVSRRQAEQRSGALQAIYGQPTREAITAERRFGKRLPVHRTTRDYARDWKQTHGLPSIAAAERDPEFKAALHRFRDRSIPWSERRALAEREFGWEWNFVEHTWRYP